MLWPAVIFIAAIFAGIVAFADLDSPLRPIIVLAFLSICPGMAIVRLLGVMRPLVEVTLAVALSLALDTLVPLTMLYVGVWSPEGSLGVLIGVSLVGAGLQVLQARHTARHRLSERRARRMAVVTGSPPPEPEAPVHPEDGLPTAEPR